MPGPISSVVTGTAGLTTAAIAAAFLSISRPALPAGAVPRIRRLTLFGVLLQLTHFAEEYASGFNVRFPELLGLPPWSLAFFVSFNLVWVILWILAAASLSSHPRMALFPIWFLAIASLANGIFHPLAALATGGYFPGLWTSPLVGVLGVVLVRALASATSGARAAA